MKNQPECKIYVVSLLRATDRRKNILSQMVSLGLDFSFVDAVDAKKIDPEELLAHVDASAVMLRRGRMLTAPEIGCALSHRKIYEDIVRSERSGAIILEDDIQIGSGFEDVMKYFCRAGPSLAVERAIYHLGALSRPYGRYLMLRKRSRRAAGGNAYFAEWIGGISPEACGTFGYYVTRAAAESFLAEEKLRDVADAWSLWANRVSGKIFVSVPAIVHHPEDLSDSEIEPDRRYLLELQKAGRVFLLARNVYYGVRARSLRYFVKPFVERLL